MKRILRPIPNTCCECSRKPWPEILKGHILTLLCQYIVCKMKVWKLTLAITKKKKIIYCKYIYLSMYSAASPNASFHYWAVICLFVNYWLLLSFTFLFLFQMSLTIQQIILDAKRLAGRLKDHDSTADSLLSQAQTVYKTVDTMKQVIGNMPYIYLIFTFIA